MGSGGIGARRTQRSGVDRPALRQRLGLAVEEAPAVRDQRVERLVQQPAGEGPSGREDPHLGEMGVRVVAGVEPDEARGDVAVLDREQRDAVQVSPASRPRPPRRASCEPSGRTSRRPAESTVAVPFTRLISPAIRADPARIENR